jgi:hypothetical protein
MHLSILRSCWLMLGVILLFAGCEQDTVADFKALQTSLTANPEPPADRFWSEITFCERVSKKSGKRIRQGNKFLMKEKSYVHGLLDLWNLPPDKTHSIHLVWLRPDARELFRRYAEVRTTAVGDSQQTRIVWLDAEDFGYRKEEIQLSNRPLVTLSSRLTTSLGRQRLPGQYTLRVYLNRELLTEEKFDLAGS